MSSSHPPWDFSDEKTCTVLFNKNVFPKLPELNVNTFDYSRSYFVEVLFRRSTEIRGNGLQICVDKGSQKIFMASFLTITGRLFLDNVKKVLFFAGILSIT